MFRGQSISDYFCDKQREAQGEIASLCDHPSKFCQESEFGRIFGKHTLERIEILEDKIYALPPKHKSTSVVGAYGRTVVSDCTELTLCLPIVKNDSVKQILSLAASTFSSAGPPDFSFNQDLDQFELVILIQNVKEAARVRERAVKGFKDFIGWKNRDIDGGNRCLESCIREHLEKRFATLERNVSDADTLVNVLGIPIKDAPKRKQRHTKVESDEVKGSEKISNIKLFFSHSSKDQDLAADLVDLINACVVFPENSIRCTSVPGFKLPGGGQTSSRLKEEIKTSLVVIGLLTKQSLASSYVLFELGAAWGKDVSMKPLLGPNTDYPDLKGPLSESNVLKLTERSDVIQLIDELASEIGLEKKNGPHVDRKITNFLKSLSKTPKP